MDLSNLFTPIGITGLLTVIFATLVKIVGFPDQIRKNYLRRSTKGLSSLFIVLTFVSYFLWSLYGLLRGDLVVVFGHVLGVLSTGIVLMQIYIYRKSK